MKQFLKNIFIAWLFLGAYQSNAQYSYKINLQGDPIMKIINGTSVAGETNIRVKIYGENEQTLIGGKLCIGDFATITIKDKPDIGTISGLDVELTGKGWTKPLKINNINIKKESDDGTVSKKYSFSCGCLLTQGNAKVQIDEGGPMNFVEAEIAAPEFKLEGQFSNQEVTFKEENIGGTISKTRLPKGEKPNGQPIVSKTPKQICTTVPVQATSSFDINFIQNPNEANIFPGAMLYSEDIANGSYASYASGSDLNPINLTTTIAIVGGNPTITVADPDLGTINTAINDLLINQTKGEMEVQASFEVSEINSMEELTLKLGAHFNSATFDAKLSADLNSSTKKSIKMVKFVQKYYSVTMVQPKKPTDMFKNKEKAIEAFESGKTPLYVNSITYGRVCYFFLESEQSASDIKIAADAEYKGSVTAGGNGDLQLKKDIDQMKYSATIIGGTGANGILAVNGFEGFMKMLQDDGKLEKSALALPISYSCKFLADNKQAFINLFSSYTKRTCEPVVNDKIKCQFVLQDIKYVSGNSDEKDFAHSFSVIRYVGDVMPPTSFSSNPFFFTSEKGFSNTKSYFPIKKGDSYQIDATSDIFEISLKDYESGNINFMVFAKFKTWWGLNSYVADITPKRYSIKDVLVLGQQAAAPPEQTAKKYRCSLYDVVVEFSFYIKKIN